MKRRELEKALMVLETTPLLLAKLEEVSPAEAAKMRLGGASLRDRVWALALLEKELWNRCIRRLLDEDDPRLEQAGEADLLRRASGLEGDHREALRVFGVFRGQNVRLLRQVSGIDWEREGAFEAGSRIRLRDVPSSMARSDQRHQSLVRAIPCEDVRRESGPALFAGFCA